MAARVERKEAGRGRRGRGVQRAATGSGDGVAAPGRRRQGDRGGQIQNGEGEVVVGGRLIHGSRVAGWCGARARVLQSQGWRRCSVCVVCVRARGGAAPGGRRGSEVGIGGECWGG